MRAVQRKAGRVSVHSIAVPRPGDDEVLIAVTVAGVCRTDVAVASGRIAVGEPLVLGHEFSGHVAGLGRDVDDLAMGSRVVAFPWLERGDFLGVDQDGGFAEYVVVPRTNVFAVPSSTPPRVAAYAEPVAAALSLVDAIAHDEHVLVRGRGRILKLLERLLAVRGHRHVAVEDESRPDGRDRQFDAIIDCTARSSDLGSVGRLHLGELLRPGGRLIRRATVAARRDGGSSTAQPGQAPPQRPPWRECIVRYGSFSEAVALLVEGRVVIDDLLGPVAPLEAAADVLRHDDAEESSALGAATKAFLAPDPACAG